MLVMDAAWIFEFGEFQLDSMERVLLKNGQRVRLRPKAFETLLLLVEHAGHVLTKDKLLKALWPDSFVEECNLNYNISRLRKALGDAPDDPRYIETVPQIGFRFLARVRKRELPVGGVSIDRPLATADLQNINHKTIEEIKELLLDFVLPQLEIIKEYLRALEKKLDAAPATSDHIEDKDDQF